MSRQQSFTSQDYWLCFSEKLSELISSGTAANFEAVEIVGTALAELHGQRPGGLTQLNRKHEAEVLLARSEVIGSITVRRDNARCCHNGSALDQFDDFALRTRASKFNE